MCFGYGKLDEIKIGISELNYKASCRYLEIHLVKKLLFQEHIDYVGNKLNKFCGLIYGVGYFFSRKCLFYNCFAKSIVFYDRLIYGSAVKTNFQKKIECAQRRILIAIFSEKKIDSMVTVLSDHKIPNVFDFSWWKYFNCCSSKFERNHPWNCL